jgi:hypothetical protein
MKYLILLYSFICIFLVNIMTLRAKELPKKGPEFEFLQTCHDRYDPANFWVIIMQKYKDIKAPNNHIVVALYITDKKIFLESHTIIKTGPKTKLKITLHEWIMVIAANGIQKKEYLSKENFLRLFHKYVPETHYSLKNYDQYILSIDSFDCAATN